MKKIIIFIISIFIIISCSTRDIVYGGIKTLNESSISKDELFNIGLAYGKNWETLRPRAKYKFNEKQLDDIKYYEYYEKESENAIIMVHGGAFMMPLFDVYLSMLDEILEGSKDKDFQIYILDYKAGHYPSQSIELYKLIDHVYEKHKKVILIGDSSGGNIVTSTAIMRKDSKQKIADGLLLLSPWLDLTNTVDSRVRNYDKDIIIGVKDDPIMLRDNPYVRGENLKDPYISPIFQDDFKNFPPTMIQVGDDEMLYDDSLILYNKLKKYNVDVEMIEFKNVFHVFQLMTILEESKEAYKDMNIFIDKIFDKE